VDVPKVKRHGDGFAELTYDDDDSKPPAEKKLPWLDDDVPVPVKTPVETEKPERHVVEKKDAFVEEKPESIFEPSVAEVAQGAPPWVARSPEGRKPTVMQVVSKPFVREVKDNRNLFDEQIAAASQDALPVENPAEGRNLSHDEAVDKAREIWRKKQEEESRKGLVGRLAGMLGFK
jgi:hypothetical protein